MGNGRNVPIDITRVAAAVGIILSHVDMTGYGSAGVLCGQFLSVRFSLMFFLAVIGFYVEKEYQAGKTPVPRRVCALLRIYGVWSLIYLVLSFVMLVFIQKMPLGQYLLSRIKSFLFSGSYYHFWFYPAAIYALVFIGCVKRLLGNRALRVLVPLAVVLYTIGLLGTGYLPIGRQIHGLRAIYGQEEFETVMHLLFLGFPAVVFGMAAAQEKGKRVSGRMLLLAAAAYVAESVILCVVLGWREDPQMLISTPLLTVLFLRWAQNSTPKTGRGNTLFCRVLSAGIYNVHPLLLAAFAIVLPDLSGIWSFLMCAVFAACFGWMLYRVRNNRFFALFL